MRRAHSKSLVFLTEVLLALTIFALCSSVCAGLLSWSHRLNEDSGALSEAVIKAQSAAEAFKVCPAAAELALVIGGTAAGDGCAVYYDRDWREQDADGAAYTMAVKLTETQDLRRAEILVSDLEGTLLFRLETAALPGGDVR